MERTEYSRTECVYPVGEPRVGQSGDGNTVEYRDFHYFAVLSDGGERTGTNRGVVDIDLQPGTGTGSIRGSVEIRDSVMGEFDGWFRGQYEQGLWKGRGTATGVGDFAGLVLTVELQAFHPGPETCSPHPEYGAAVDGAFWTVAITTES